MATYTVTTNADVVDAADGVLSLREAIAAANATAAADTIVFSAAVSNSLFVSVGTSANRQGFIIEAAGGALTINGDRDDDGQGDIAFTNGFGTKFTVNQGANLTLIGVDFVNGNSQATPAANGASQGRAASSEVPAGPASIQGGYAVDLDGDNILDGNEATRALAYFGQDALDNTDAGDGADGGAGEKGEDRAGAISNAGTLTLVRVGFGDNNAEGGLGGTGGRGGDGGFTFGGRAGIQGHEIRDLIFFNNVKHPLWVEPGDGGDGGNGSNGGDGGDGGAGGAGGNAGGAILNQAGATLSLTDVVFGGRLVSGYLEDGNTATGGRGGQGGGGGWGSNGGRGGNGGNDGNTEDTFQSSLFIIDENGNRIDFTEAQVVDPGTLYSGLAGIGGDGGAGGNGGNAGGNGRGGSAAGSILNLGTLNGRAAITDFNSATAGVSTTTIGAGGVAGTGGAAGLGGLDYPEFFRIEVGTLEANIIRPTRSNAASGTAGAAGLTGASGSVGPTGQASGGIVTTGSGTQAVTNADALVYLHRLNGGTDATDTISFNVIRVGDVGSTLTVNWRIVGTGANAVTAADFAGGALPTGSVVLQEVTGYTLGASYDRYAAGIATAKSVVRVDVALAAGTVGELREGFRIEVTSVVSNKPAIGATLGTAAVNGFVAGVAPAGPTQGPDSLTGGAAPDNIAGLGGNDTLTGLGGSDTLDGGAGNDLMRGGTENDRYIVDSLGDSILELANQGTDTVFTILATYVIAPNVENVTATTTIAHRFTGNALNNVITGNAGSDTLVGGVGNDTLQGGGAVDWLYGGLNNDTYLVETATDRVIEFANQGIDTVRTAAPTYALPINVENLVGTSTNGQTLTGNGLANAITGFTGADTLNGGLGDDTLDGGASVDRLLGGIGNDTYRIEAASDVIVEFANQGTDTVIMLGSTGYTLGANLENLVIGGAVGTVGVGNALNNAITGNAASNTLFGQAGNDSVDGGGGLDVLVGGLGRDTLTGGAGNDQFRFLAPGETTLLAPDRITDFTQGQDRIDLRLIDGAFATPLTYVAGAPVAAGQVGVVAIGAGVWQVRGDLDGGGADFAITVVSATGPSAAWFLL